MTQYIPPTEGKTYNPEHLRAAKNVEELLTLAKQGHPLAWHDGSEVTHLFEPSASFLIAPMYTVRVWAKYHWSCFGIPNLKDDLRLAPLAYKDGKPLHVGDVIEYRTNNFSDFDNSQAVTMGWINGLRHHTLPDWMWRWPVEEMTALFWQPPPVTKCGECPESCYGHYGDCAIGTFAMYQQNKNGITETCPKWQEQNKEVK